MPSLTLGYFYSGEGGLGERCRGRYVLYLPALWGGKNVDFSFFFLLQALSLGYLGFWKGSGRRRRSGDWGRGLCPVLHSEYGCTCLHDFNFCFPILFLLSYFTLCSVHGFRTVPAFGILQNMVRSREQCYFPCSGSGCLGAVAGGMLCVCTHSKFSGHVVSLIQEMLSWFLWSGVQ